MATDQLVRSEIDEGVRLIEVLDGANFGAEAALWLYSGETDTWRFVIATRGDAKAIAQRYMQAAQVISLWKEQHQSEVILNLDRVKFISVNDPLVQGLRRIVQMGAIGGIRFSNNIVNGVYVEDALIHRLAA